MGFGGLWFGGFCGSAFGASLVCFGGLSFLRCCSGVGFSTLDFGVAWCASVLWCGWCEFGCVVLPGCGSFWFPGICLPAWFYCGVDIIYCLCRVFGFVVLGEVFVLMVVGSFGCGARFVVFGFSVFGGFGELVFGLVYWRSLAF